MQPSSYPNETHLRQSLHTPYLGLRFTGTSALGIVGNAQGGPGEAKVFF